MSERWSIDPLHSHIGFTVRHMVVAKVRGRFTTWSAELNLDNADLTRSSVNVRIDAGSVDTGVEGRDADLRSANFFDVANHPEIVFASKKVVAAGDDRLDVTGDLTIRGTTREIVLKVEAAGIAKDPWGGTRAGFTASASIDRKAFGLTYNQILETGGLLVGDKVEIHIDVEAVQQKDSEKAA